MFLSGENTETKNKSNTYFNTEDFSELVSFGFCTERKDLAKRK